jgi:hypothetical protein
VSPIRGSLRKLGCPLISNHPFRIKSYILTSGGINMRKLLVFLGMLVLVATLAPSAALAEGKVEYTWTLSALGQGGWVGGPLFADGTVGGGGAFSFSNGRVLADIAPTTWSENAAGEVTVCFNIIERRGPPGALPPALCFGPATPTGTATKIIFLGDEHIFRVTELQ